MDFDKWLKKRVIKDTDVYTVIGTGRDFELKGIGKLISIKDLGKWAIDYYLNESGPYEDGILEAIAIACLGKKTVEKKFKEASK